MTTENENQATEPAAVSDVRGEDGGKPPYADPTGNTAAANVDRDRAQDERARRGDGKEAAKYRRQLRDVEAERDTLRDQLAAFQRQAIDEQAVLGGIKPAALWGSGAELATLLHDDGRVNADAVATAIATAVDTFGIQLTASARDAGITGAVGGGLPAEPTWAGIAR